MRKQDLSPDRQKNLMPCKGREHIHALRAPPTPRSIPESGQIFSFTAASQAIGRLEQALKTIPNSDLVTRTLARREAVQSSQIEGTRADLPQLLTYEATRGMEGLPPDVQVTERYVQALEVGLEAVRTGGRAALTLDLLHELHTILMQDDPRDFPRGAYRQVQVWIGPSRIEDAVFVPAPPEALDELMDDLDENMFRYKAKADEQGELSIPAQLAIAHAQFETIHPYHDGNGRTGRLLMSLILAAEGYPPLYLSGALLRSQRGYYDALASVQLRGIWKPWVDLLNYAIVEACDDAISIATDLDALQKEWSQQIARFRSDSAIKQLPAFLLGQPVVSVFQVAQALGVTSVAANTAINELLKLGIVEIIDPKRKRGRVFVATRILDRLATAPQTKTILR